MSVPYQLLHLDIYIFQMLPILLYIEKFLRMEFFIKDFESTVGVYLHTCRAIQLMQSTYFSIQQLKNAFVERVLP